MRSLASRASIIGLIGLTLLIPAAANAGYVVSVDAGPSCIPADGKSVARIIVTVLDQSGTPVPDGTDVRLTTTAGDITPIAYTSGGRAAGILTSSVSAQIAMVNATVAGVTGTAQVEFAASNEASVGGARTVRVVGGSLAYSVERDTLLASDSATLDYKGITIRSASAQVCQMLGVIRAQGAVSVQLGRQTFGADALTCDMRTDQIRLLDSGDQCSVRTLDTRKLRLIGTENAPALTQEFAPLDGSGARTWIVSRRAVIYPGEKVVFFKASIYVGDSKVIRMPYYCYSYEKRESILQQVRYTSADGLLVDLPFYYRTNDSGVGALKLRYSDSGGESGGYFRPRKGMSLGVEQTYLVNDRSQGRVFVDAVGSSNQTYELTHHLEFGSAANSARADITSRYQPSSSYARGIYNTSLNVTGGLGNCDYSVSGYFGGSRIQQWNYLQPGGVEYVSQSDCSIRTVITPRALLRTRRGLRLTPSLTVGYGGLGFSPDGRSSSCLYQSLGLAFGLTRMTNRRASLSFDGSSAFTMTADGDKGVSLRAGPSLRYNWNGGNTSLRYTLNAQAGSARTASSLSRHSLGANLFLSRGGRWSANAFADYGLDTGMLSLFSGAACNLRWNWQLRTSYNFYRYAGKFNGRAYSFETAYLKLGIVHPLGPYEIGLAWSPQGQDYGLNRSKRIWLEFGARGF